MTEVEIKIKGVEELTKKLEKAKYHAEKLKELLDDIKEFKMSLEAIS